MKFYADARVRIEPAPMLAEANSKPTLEQARDVLLEAGMLEQVLADEAGYDPGIVHAAGELTDWAAERFSRLLQGFPVEQAPVPERVATWLAALPDVQAVLPEGYFLYALYPEWYERIGTAIGEQGSGPVVVVGVRSIGSSLSAVTAAGIRRAGRATWRYTVRPVGDPFEREVQADQALTSRWRDAATRGARFVVVDEGPGLSGSSIASTVRALLSAGAEAETITIVCAMPPGSLPMASDHTHRLWQTIRWHATADQARDFWKDGLPALLGVALRCEVAFVRDLSWGAWAAGTETAQPVLAQLERRKLLLRIGGHDAVAKFIGFGKIGRRKAELNQMLSEAGFVPPYLGYAHGMLLQEWIDAPRGDSSSDGERTKIIVAAADYYAHLRRNCVLSMTPNLQEIAGTVGQIAAAWLGESTTRQVRSLAHAASDGGARALSGDQKPERVEWLVREGQVLKCDAADHYLDHSWAREQDICFDLAGLCHEFALTDPERRTLLELYARASGDHTAVQRLPFYAAVYTAHRLAALDTGYTAQQNGAALELTTARARAGDGLRMALRGSQG